MNDFLTDINTNELLFSNGDFAFGDSTKQYQKSILLATKGSFKESPMLGVGILEELHTEDPNDLYRNIRMEMVKDGMVVDDLKIVKNGVIEINAFYENS